MTREQTYSELLVAVADSESRIDKLRRENEVLRARLNELKIGAEELNNAPSKSNENMRDESGTSEQSEMFSSVKLLQKYNNVKIVQDLVDGWARKVIVKIDDDISEERCQEMDIVDIFEKAWQIVVSNLEEYENDDEDDMGPASNMMNDFLTDEFISKNIRVRPSSGKTEAGDGDRGAHGTKNGNYTDNLEDNVDKVYNDDLIELDAQRKNIKDKIIKQQEEIARKNKLEKAEK